MFDIQESGIVLSNKTVESKVSCQRIFYDIEGGLSYNSDVLQLAYLRTDWDFNITEVVSRYFRNSGPITVDEYNVHGLTSEYLWTHASNYFLTELPKFPFFEETPTMYITYSSFDITKIREAAQRSSLPEIDFGLQVSSLTCVPTKANHFDAFILGKTKLSKSITPSMQEEIRKVIANMPPHIDVSRLKAHDALYDTIVMFALCKEMMRK